MPHLWGGYPLRIFPVVHGTSGDVSMKRGLKTAREHPNTRRGTHTSINVTFGHNQRTSDSIQPVQSLAILAVYSHVGGDVHGTSEPQEKGETQRQGKVRMNDDICAYRVLSRVGFA